MLSSEATSDLIYGKNPQETLADLEKTLSRLGRVDAVDAARLLVFGKIRYGLFSVQVKAFVAESGRVSRIHFSAQSDDTRAVGAENAIQRWIETLQNMENPGFAPNKTGMSKGCILTGIIFLLLIIIFLSLFVFWPNSHIPQWVIVILVGAGVLSFIYFVIINPNLGKK